MFRIMTTLILGNADRFESPTFFQIKLLESIPLQDPCITQVSGWTKRYSEDNPDSHSTQTQNPYIIVHNDSKLWRP